MGRTDTACVSYKRINEIEIRQKQSYRGIFVVATNCG